MSLRKIKSNFWSTFQTLFIAEPRAAVKDFTDFTTQAPLLSSTFSSFLSLHNQLHCNSIFSRTFSVFLWKKDGVSPSILILADSFLISPSSSYQWSTTVVPNEISSVIVLIHPWRCSPASTFQPLDFPVGKIRFRWRCHRLLPTRIGPLPPWSTSSRKRIESSTIVMIPNPSQHLASRKRVHTARPPPDLQI